jgi:hypothetical protein
VSVHVVEHGDDLVDIVHDRIVVDIVHDRIQQLYVVVDHDQHDVEPSPDDELDVHQHLDQLLARADDVQHLVVHVELARADDAADDVDDEHEHVLDHVDDGRPTDRH